MLQPVFVQLLSSYTSSEMLIRQLWSELEIQYSTTSRYYHTLQHLENMYGQLLPVKDAILDWDTILFSLFYHDIIYNATAKDNEEKSAMIAEKILQVLDYPVDRTALCKAQILATKSHVFSDDTDTNYFTDADLSILGAAGPEYGAYTKAIRKEYAIYPDMLYKPGRRKVLQHFSSMEKIYKTAYFRDRYEAKARENMQQELLALQ